MNWLLTLYTFLVIFAMAIASIFMTHIFSTMKNTPGEGGHGTILIASAIGWTSVAIAIVVLFMTRNRDFELRVTPFFIGMTYFIFILAAFVTFLIGYFEMKRSSDWSENVKFNKRCIFIIVGLSILIAIMIFATYLLYTEREQSGEKLSVKTKVSKTKLTGRERKDINSFRNNLNEYLNTLGYAVDNYTNKISVQERAEIEKQINKLKRQRDIQGILNEQQKQIQLSGKVKDINNEFDFYVDKAKQIDDQIAEGEMDYIILAEKINELNIELQNFENRRSEELKPYLTSSPSVLAAARYDADIQLGQDVIDDKDNILTELTNAVNQNLTYLTFRTPKELPSYLDKRSKERLEKAYSKLALKKETDLDKYVKDMKSSKGSLNVVSAKFKQLQNYNNDLVNYINMVENEIESTDNLERLNELRRRELEREQEPVASQVELLTPARGRAQSASPEELMAAQAKLESMPVGRRRAQTATPEELIAARASADIETPEASIEDEEKVLEDFKKEQYNEIIAKYTSLKLSQEDISSDEDLKNKRDDASNLMHEIKLQLEIDEDKDRQAKLIDLQLKTYKIYSALSNEAQRRIRTLNK